MATETPHNDVPSRERELEILLEQCCLLLVDYPRLLTSEIGHTWQDDMFKLLSKCEETLSHPIDFTHRFPMDIWS